MLASIVKENIDNFMVSKMKPDSCFPDAQIVIG